MISFDTTFFIYATSLDFIFFNSTLEHVIDSIPHININPGYYRNRIISTGDIAATPAAVNN